MQVHPQHFVQRRQLDGAQSLRADQTDIVDDGVERISVGKLSQTRLRGAVVTEVERDHRTGETLDSMPGNSHHMMTR